MRPLAAWLVARPQNAVIGLAATLLLPFAQVISGTVMSLLVLRQGAPQAALHGVIAVALLLVISLILGVPVSQVLANAAVIWVPVMLLAALLRSRRSLTLTLQVAALIALLVTLAFYLLLGDPATYWSDVLVNVAAAFRDMGLQQHADTLLAQREVVAAQMTTLVVLATWSLYVTVLLLGYAIFRMLVDKPAEFGRFCDLNFGKVLALTMAITSVLAVLTGSVWLQNLAFVAFALFWLQGLAIVHWLHAERGLPLLLVILVYALLPLLNALLIMALAILGYIDAWFEFRRRKVA
ncbi:MAG TPA: DUF2232 domain-containing protein [Woeseiaceae bacterium]